MGATLENRVLARQESKLEANFTLHVSTKFSEVSSGKPEVAAIWASGTRGGPAAPLGGSDGHKHARVAGRLSAGALTCRCVDDGPTLLTSSLSHH